MQPSNEAAQTWCVSESLADALGAVLAERAVLGDLVEALEMSLDDDPDLRSTPRVA